MDKESFSKKKDDVGFCKKTKEISNRLEFLMISNDTKAKELASFIGINYPNFSRIRSDARRGIVPSKKFLIGISNYYKENFFSFLLDFNERK